MEAMDSGESSTVPKSAGCLKTVAGVGLGLALGALAGIVVGLVAGVGIAMALGVL
ncbi:hypothetical protein ACFLUM_00500 [Chloroflexota bacterium]